MKKIIFPVLCLLFSVSEASAAGSPGGTLAQSDSLTQKYTATGYSIAFPGSWTLDTSGQMGTRFFIFSPVGNEGDEFQENVNLIIQDLQGAEVSLEEYASLSVGQIESMFQNARIDENKSGKDASGNYHRFAYSGGINEVIIYCIQKVWLENGKAYILTFTCKPETVKQYEALGNRILDSFRIR